MNNCTDCSFPAVQLFSSMNSTPSRATGSPGFEPVEGVPYNPNTASSAPLSIEATNSSDPNQISSARPVAESQSQSATLPYQASGEAAVVQRVGTNINVNV